MESKNPKTEQAIKEHCADGALRKLVAAGCEERMLINGLSLMRDSADLDSWGDLIGQAWPGYRGDLKRRLKGSINKIRECAAEIKSLESTKLWALMLSVRSQYSPPDSQFLPWSQALESYADTWTQVIGVAGPQKHPFQAEVKAWLVAYVKETTDDWHDEEVSALIAAVMDKPSYDAGAHRQWRHENKDLVRDRQAELRQTNHPESA